MRRMLSFCAAALLVGLATPSTASAQQSINLFVGGSVPRSLDARSGNDVLVDDLDFLSFNFNHFRGATVGGEWLVGLGDLFEGGLGLGLYSRTTPSVYAGYVNADGSEIRQDLKLRVVPFTATFRFLPLGHHDAFVPYIGAGVGVFAWRYSESGQFIDFTDSSIFRNTYVGSGTAAGPVVLGGLRVPVGSWGLGGEIRYQAAQGNLPADQEFAGPKIDLGGFNYLFTVNFNF